MNRMGFVNFWLYDREIFSFSDGKLLLRGQNASGKSITTQSFIPFILDGDRTPSRLDPFGSSDRKMDYYFLGDGEREDVTGYLFLEFKREGVEEYRTIGIGQRAQRGKSSMGFWGFVLLDGRRVGEDLELAKSAGSQYVPLTKQELKNLLGEDNFFTETQREYMAAVNRYLFGFERLEQYEQFIRLLVKVRAPKLSKEFKPSRVYEILNDSLQTLSDEDLRAMVDAMEKMDDIEMNLESLRKAARDLRTIGTEYRRYNEFILGKKGEQYRRAKEKREEDAVRAESLERKIRQAREEYGKRAEAENGFLEEIRVLEGRLQAFHADELQKSLKEINSLREKAEETEAETERLKGEIERKREQIREKDAELRASEKEKEAAESDLEDAADLLAEYQEILQFEAHDLLMALRDFSEEEAGYSVDTEYRDVLARLQKWSGGIRSALKSLERQEREEAEREEEERKTDLLQLEANEAKRHAEDARQLEDNCRDEQLLRLHRCHSENQELLLKKEEFDRLSGMIRDFTGNTERMDAQEIWFRAFRRREGAITSDSMKSEAERKAAADRIRKLEAEWEELEKVRELVPERREAVKETRESLKAAGIPFLPVYEAVDFSETLEEPVKARMERALEEAGLLNALLVPETDYERALQLVRSHADTLVRLDLCREYAGTGRSASAEEKPVKAARLSGKADKEEELISAAALFCNSISGDPENSAPFILAPSGYFRNGLLEGCVEEDATGELRFVGAETRRLRLEKQKEEKRAELAAARGEEEKVREKLLALAARKTLLDKEYGEIPDFGELEQAFVLRKNEEKTEEEVRARLLQQEERREAARGRCRAAAAEVLEACKGFPYPRKADAFREAEGAAEDYRDQADFWHESLRQREIYLQKSRMIQDSIDHLEEHIDELDAVRRQRFFETRGLQERLLQLEKMLADPDTKRILKELEETEKRLREVKKSQEENRLENARLSGQLAEWEETLEPVKAVARRSVFEEEKLREYLLEEAELEEHENALASGNLIRDRLLGAADPDQGQGELTEGKLTHEKLADRIAELALRNLRENDRNKSEAELLQNFLKIFQAHSGSIARYSAGTENCFGDSEIPGALRKRQILTAAWQGNQMPITTFSRMIRESIEATEMLIQEEDRKLFEDILSDTLSRKLTARIHESRSWIRDMSALMQGMNTSMGLTFSLRWSARTSEGEGQLGAEELEKILARDRELLTAEDVARVAEHFRSAIRQAKEEALERGDTVNYRDLVRDALDYRKWFEFRMYYTRAGENSRELTDRVFNRFSGGEKAMAMYVPLFASVNAQYRKSGKLDHPRIIALDEAFAGVDDKNISSMFELVETLDFDYIMNSQALWGCFDTVHNLSIAELLRPENSQVITVIFYHWNGKKKELVG